MTESIDEKPQRQLDPTNAQVRRAVSATLDLFQPWRNDLVRLQALAVRRHARTDLVAMIARCSEIEREVRAARTTFLAELSDVPERVRRSTRVTDVERALDDVDAAVAKLRVRLTP